MADPEQQGMLRYWNGEQWTEHRMPMQQQQPPQPAQPQSPPRPGWYPDPRRPGWSRFWNGTYWVNGEYKQTEFAPAPPSARWSLTKVFLVWWGAAAAALAAWSFVDILDAPALVAGDLLAVNLFASALLGAAASGVVTGIVAISRRGRRAGSL